MLIEEGGVWMNSAFFIYVCSMKLELQVVKAPTPKHFAHAIIAMLTGYEIEEILLHLPITETIRTNTYKNTFHKLGYNCNNRFIKFDPKTEHPCIMRTQKKGEKGGYWYGFVYFDNKVFHDNGYIEPFEHFLFNYSNLRVTSMLQVYL